MHRFDITLLRQFASLLKRVSNFMTSNPDQSQPHDLEDSRNAFIEIKTKIENVLKSPITPVASAGVYAVFMLRLSFYCNKMDVPFFDFMGETGIYIGIFAVLAAFLFSVSISYYFFPVHVSNELNQKLGLRKFYAILVSSSAGISAYILIAAIVTKNIGQFFFISMIVFSIVTAAFVVSIFFFFHSRGWKKLYEMVVAANFFSLSQCLITSAIIIALLETIPVVNSIPSTGFVAVVFSIIIFVIGPMIVQALIYSIPGLRKPRDIVIASLAIGFFLIFWSFDWTMGRIINFLNLGGDVRAELIFRPDSRGAATELGLYAAQPGGPLKPVPVILRFQGNAYAFVYLGNHASEGQKPNVLAINLRDISAIHICENQSDGQGCGRTS